nr:YdhK family protein [Tissierella sp.]
MKKSKMLFIALGLSITLMAGCTTNGAEDPKPEEGKNPPIEGEHDMVHDDSGEIPAGLKEAEAPTYKVGDNAKILTDHMEGMEGATATVVGAFDTVAYEVSYNPTNGDPREENHKWVIHEEIKEAGAEPLKAGDEVVIEASHMEGMEGATATIESAKETTVYMIDYEPTTGGEKVKNHKWVTDSELSAE